MILGQTVPVAGMPGAQEVWEQKGGTGQGSVTLEGSRSLHPTFPGVRNPLFPAAPALLGPSPAGAWPGRRAQEGCKEMLCSAPYTHSWHRTSSSC